MTAVPLIAQKIECVEDVLANEDRNRYFKALLERADDGMFAGEKGFIKELIEAIAILSKMPRGVRFLGMHFNYSGEGREGIYESAETELQA